MAEPRTDPSTEPAAPTMAPSMRKMRCTVRVVVPVAFRIPISRAFWTTETHQHAGDAERHGEHDEDLDHPARGRLRAQADEQLLVEAHPAVGDEAGAPPISRASRSASKISATLSSMVVTPPGRSSIVCADAQRDEDPALVHVLVAEVEDARDGEDVAAPLGAWTSRILSPTATPRSLRQHGADDGLGALQREARRRPSSGRSSMTRCEARRVDAPQRHRLGGRPPAREGRAGRPWAWPPRRPGSASTDRSTCCHCSMERMRLAGPSRPGRPPAAGEGSGRATRSGA